MDWPGGDAQNPDFVWVYDRYKHLKWAPLSQSLEWAIGVPIADLVGSDPITADHVGEAIGLRSLERQL